MHDRRQIERESICLAGRGSRQGDYSESPSTGYGPNLPSEGRQKIVAISLLRCTGNGPDGDRGPASPWGGIEKHVNMNSHEFRSRANSFRLFRFFSHLPLKFHPQWLVSSSSVAASPVSLLLTLSSSEVQTSFSSTNNRTSCPSIISSREHLFTSFALRFMGGNSTKATSGINGAGTQSQQDLGIQDSARIFFEDTKKSVRVLVSRTILSLLNPCTGSRARS